MPKVDFSLYLITDRQQTLGRPLIPLIDDALRAGLQAMQIRERDLETRDVLTLSEEVRTLTRRHRGLCFINDRLDVALAIGADGVHLRADSMPVAVARRLLGANRYVGVSAHSADEAIAAGGEGADFVVLGPVYDTPSKRAYGSPIGLRPLEEASLRCAVPIFAVGGISVARVREVRQAGAFGVAVISSVLTAPDVGSATAQLLNALAESP